MELRGIEPLTSRVRPVRLAVAAHVALKGAAGAYSQPPDPGAFSRVFGDPSLRPQRGTQYVVGVDVDPTGTLHIEVEGFYKELRNLVVPGIVPGGPALVGEGIGRAYGGELLARQQLAHNFFGWISYTLSRSERYRDTIWVPYDFDRTHLVNVVAGLPLPRNWDVGVRGQYQSGRPATDTSGYNAARNAGYLRIDLRVDKRAVYRRWLLDFYVDITNVALLPEEVQPGTVIRYVLPTVGLRGRF